MILVKTCLRFSTRLLLSAVLLECVAAGLVSIDLQKDRNHQRAVAKLTEAAGIYRNYRFEFSSRRVAPLTSIEAIKNSLGFKPIDDRFDVVIHGPLIRGTLISQNWKTHTSNQRLLRIGNYLDRLRNPEGIGLMLCGVEEDLLRSIVACKSLGKFNSIVLEWDNPKTTISPEALTGFRGTHIVALRLGGRSCDDRLLTSLGPLADLRLAHLSNTGITQEGMRALSRSPDLHLSMVVSDLSPATADLLHEAESLHYLDLASPLNGFDLQDLRDLRNLKVLFLRTCDLSTDQLNRLPGLPSLIELQVQGNERIERIDDAILDRLPNLSKLDVSWTGMSVKQCEHIQDRYPAVTLTMEGIVD